MLDCYFFLGFHTINWQFLNNVPQIVWRHAISFFKSSQLLFGIYSGFFVSLSVSLCWVNDVHVGAYAVLFSVQSISIFGTMIIGYWGLLLWFFKNSQLFYRIYSWFSGLLCMDQCRFNDIHVGLSLIHRMSRLKCGRCVPAWSPYWPCICYRFEKQIIIYT